MMLLTTTTTSWRRSRRRRMRLTRLRNRRKKNQNCPHALESPNFTENDPLYHLSFSMKTILNGLMQSQTNKENTELLDQTPKVSIQEAFKKFQKEKFYQLKLNKYLKNIQVDRTTQEFKSQLRQKFIETAHKYIGVPYAQKFHQAGDPLYSAPLFIDCCALVRQCIFDLRQEFGYTLGKWNQSYQFDLLPDQGLTEQDLKPGDLIFYSATYSNPKLKPFPHRMVHVQIYMGEGRTIGARWQKGTIQVFDSYKFQSNLYHDIEFHYRSIDSWLEGKFISHCQQHKWLDERANQWLSDKFSVFADPSLDDMDVNECEKVESRKVFVGKGNNSKLVSNYFKERERYDLMGDKDQFSHHFFFKWVQSTGEIDFYSFKEGTQIVNHIPNICVITHKLDLLKTLKQLQHQLIDQGKKMTPPVDSFMPKTYRLDVMSDQIDFLKDNTEGIWIYKPRNLNQGKGIRLIQDITVFKKEFIQSKKFYLGQFALNHMIHYKPELNPANTQNSQNQTTKYSNLRQDGLIQHYIKPLLLSKKKFDIRCYLFYNTSPCLALFNQGYLRLTIDDYTEVDIESEKNLMVHLTNNAFQTKHQLYKQKKEDTIAKWNLIESQIGVQATKILRDKVKGILLAVMTSAKRKLIAKRGTYELLGCDVIVDEKLQPFLLEVNTNPAMFTDTQIQKQLLPVLAKNTLDIALELFQTQTCTKILQTLPERGYQLLYCEQTSKIYNSTPQHPSINGLPPPPSNMTHLKQKQINLNQQ